MSEEGVNICTYSVEKLESIFFLSFSIYFFLLLVLPSFLIISLSLSLSLCGSATVDFMVLRISQIELLPLIADHFGPRRYTLALYNQTQGPVFILDLFNFFQ